MNKKDKLILCTSSFKTGWGGIASYGHDFVDAFVCTYEICVITTDDFNEDYKGVKVIKFNQKDLSIQSAEKFIHLINELNPDIIVNSGSALLSAVSPFLPDTLRIVTVSHFVDGKYATIAGFNGNYLDSIVSLSSFGKEFIANKFSIIDKEEKISVIHNALPQIDDTHIRDKANDRILKILFPGGTSYHKSADIVAKAIKKLLHTDCQFELYWIGNTNIAGYKYPLVHTRNLIDCFGEDSRIKHMGSVSREDAIRLMEDCNIFVLPSRGEGFPITLIEAMRGGCIPIISDAKHGSLDIIVHGKNGIITRQGSANSIVRAIEHILHNHEKYRNIYSNAIESARDSLNTQVWKASMHDVLTNCHGHLLRKVFSKRTYLINTTRLKYLLAVSYVKMKLSIIYNFIIYRIIRYCL